MSSVTQEGLNALSIYLRGVDTFMVETFLEYHLDNPEISDRTKLIYIEEKLKRNESEYE